MEDLINLVVFLAVIWSVVGGMFGKKKGQPAPPRPRRETGPASEVERAGKRPREEAEPLAAGGAAGRRQGAEEAAAVLVPDDLWEILTGERRAPAPRPAPEPEFEREVAWDEAWDEAGELRDETADLPVPQAEEARSLEEISQRETAWHEASGRELPRVVSLETPPPPPAARHAAFHQRLEATPAGAGAPARRPTPGGRRDRLRRAIALREILGPPKALE